MQKKAYGSPRRQPEGIEIRHARGCAQSGWVECRCEPSYRAYIYDARTKRKERKVFSGPGALAAAKQWRADARHDVARGKRVAATKRTLREAAEAWLAGAEADPPTIVNRSYRPYKPSALRDIRSNLTLHVLPELGAHRLSDIRRGDLKALASRLRGRGLSPTKVLNVINAVRVIYREALEAEEVEYNPTVGLSLEKGAVNRRDYAAEATDVVALLAALPVEDRALWATAFYAGLRRGELRGLRWEDIELREADDEGDAFGGYIRVRRSWDDEAGEILTKSDAGVRRVPIVAPFLADYLTAEQKRTGRAGSDFVFSREARRPFTPTSVRKWALNAWAAANAKRAEQKLELLRPVGLHEARHTYASLLRAAGVPKDDRAEYLGHTGERTVTDDYTHQLELDERDATNAKRFADYLRLADSRSRIKQIATADEPAVPEEA